MVRNVYRAIELGQGFDGYLSYHEAYFSVFDASLMVLAPAIFVLYWPANYVTGIPGFDNVRTKDTFMSDSTSLVLEPRGAHTRMETVAGP